MKTPVSDPQQTSPRSLAPRLSARELALLGLVLAAGVGLRVVHPGQMAVEHFDEGVYASNWWFGPAQDYQYPDRHLFAPPLLPAAIEWLFVLLGPSNLAAMVVGIATGALTLVLVWGLGRAWFGPRAGIAGAAFAALCDPHIVFSRSALTDAPLCCWLVAAVHALWKGCREGRYRWSIAGGLLTSLAWWTKYNGWLPLAITLAGIVLWAWREGIGLRQLAAAAAQWSLAAVVALATWLPCVWLLQSRGGYAEVLRNHRGYLVGWQGWAAACWRQGASLHALEGWPGVLAPLAAIGLVALLPGNGAPAAGSTWNESSPATPGTGQDGLGRAWWRLCLCLAAGLLAISIGGTAACGLLALCGLGMLISRGPGSGAESSAAVSQPGSWMLVAWWCGLLLTTPLYRPYPRLTLPWLAASWLAAGLGAVVLFDVIWKRQPITAASPSPRAGAWAAAGGLLAASILLLCWTGSGVLRPVPGWQPRTGLVDVAAQIRHEVTRGNLPDSVVYVYGEPALLFQLRLQGLELVAPVSTLSFADPAFRRGPGRIYLAAGPHAERDPRFQDQLRAVHERLRLAATYAYPPSDLVQLDEAAPTGRAGAVGRPVAAQIQLYWLR